MMKELRQRYIFPDILKAFLIFCVILGHVIGKKLETNETGGYWTNPLITFIYSFHMPCFFAISAFFQGCSKPVDNKTFYSKRFCRLFFPILAGAIICLFFDYYFHIYTTYSTSIYKKIYKYLTEYWFLNCLLLQLCFIQFYSRTNKLMQIGIWGVLIICLILYSNLPYYILKDIQLIRQMPIFIISYYIGKNRKLILPFFSKYRICIFLASTLLWYLIILIFGMNLLLYPCFVRIFIGMVSTISIISVFSILQKYLTKSIILHIGRNTLGIYILHIPLFKLLPPINSWILIFALSLLLLVITSFITDAIRKTALREFILGEKQLGK